MTIVEDLQKQAVPSPFIVLYDLQISQDPDLWIHFTADYYTSSTSTKITMRDYDTPGTINTYQVIPAEYEGVDKTTEGSLPRPTITIANVLKALDNTSLLGAIYVANSNVSLSYQDILGLRFRIRRTLKKHLYNESAASPAVELPIEEYFMDRVVQENKLQVTFELVSPFDMVGITVPRRVVISNGCPWLYTGAGDHKYHYERRGGCTWNQESKITLDGTEYTVYVNKDDEYVVPNTISFTTDPGDSSTRSANAFYKTAKSGLTKVAADLTRSTDNSQFDYWQVKNDTTSGPTDGDGDWTRVRIYDPTYTAGETYNVYTDDKYNHYVIQAANETVKGSTVSVTRLWQKKYRTGTAITPAWGPEWARGDLCSKTLNGCSKRFGVTISGGNVAATQDEDKVKPFGGFPTSRSFT